MPVPPSRPVPAGSRVVLDGIRRPGPRLLLGGSPWRLLRLSDAGDRLVDALAAGRPVPAGAPSRLVGRLVDAGMAWPRPEPDGAAVGRVVVPCRDHPEALRTTLASIPGGVPVTVVDDGSPDPAGVAAAAHLRAGTAVLRRSGVPGPAAARNAGWQAGGAGATTVVAFVDTDCSAPDGWLATLAGHFADPAVGAVAPRVLARPAPGGPRWLVAYETARGTLDRGARPGPVRPRSHVPFVPSTVLLVRGQALAEVTGFDEAMRTGEDVDLVWRLDRAGWRVRYDPTVVVTHPVRPALRSWLAQRYGYGRSAAPLAARHGVAVAPLSVSRWSALAWTLAAVGHPAAGLAVAGASVARLAGPAGADATPRRTWAGLGLRGQLLAGRSGAEALRRSWWPVAALAAARSRRLRPALVAAFVIPPLLEWRRLRPTVGPVAWLTLRLVDDVAYGAGVWAGAVRARSARCLLPDLT